MQIHHDAFKEAQLEGYQGNWSQHPSLLDVSLHHRRVISVN